MRYKDDKPICGPIDCEETHESWGRVIARLYNAGAYCVHTSDGRDVDPDYPEDAYPIWTKKLIIIASEDGDVNYLREVAKECLGSNVKFEVVSFDVAKTLGYL